MKTAALRKLKKQLQLIEDTAGEDTTIRQALVLLEVALQPGEKITHLAEKMRGETTHTAISRAADILGNHQGRNSARKPAGIVERRPIPDDRRASGLWLTPKGERLMERLAT